MAQHYLKNSPVKIGLSKAHVVAGSDPRSQDDITDPTEYQSVGDLDTALGTADATLYTQTYLDSLTMNDKIYALKLMKDSANYGML